MTLNDPYPWFQGHTIFDSEYMYLRNGTIYRQFQGNTNRDLHTPYSAVLFRMFYEWLSKIFNDNKHCAISLRQLSFLLFMFRSKKTFTFKHVQLKQPFIGPILQIIQS